MRAIPSAGTASDAAPEFESTVWMSDGFPYLRSPEFIVYATCGRLLLSMARDMDVVSTTSSVVEFHDPSSVFFRASLTSAGPYAP
jgi:hypothetical protein